MIQALHEGDEVQISVNADRGPQLYLDRFAILHLASNDELRQRFFKRFETHGELLFSNVNLMEVGLLRGASATRVRQFYRRIGVHWVPLESDVLPVVLAEYLRIHGTERPRHPALSGDLLDFVYRSGTNRDEFITLDKVIDSLPWRIRLTDTPLPRAARPRPRWVKFPCSSDRPRRPARVQRPWQTKVH